MVADLAENLDRAPSGTTVHMPRVKSTSFPVSHVVLTEWSGRHTSATLALLSTSARPSCSRLIAIFPWLAIDPPPASVKSRLMPLSSIATVLGT